MLSVVMLSALMLSVVMLSVVMPSAVMLNVVAPKMCAAMVPGFVSEKSLTFLKVWSLCFEASPFPRVLLVQTNFGILGLQVKAIY